MKVVKEQLIAEKDSLKAANEELRKELKATENEKIMLKESLAEAEEAKSRLAAELTESVEQKFALETQVARLRKEVKTAEENLRGKQLQMEGMEKRFTKLQIELKALREERLATHTGVNKKLQAGLSGLSEGPLGAHSQMGEEAKVEDVKNPLNLQDIPLVITNEKGAAAKATKVKTATLVMQSEGKKTLKKRPQRLAARGSPKVGAKIKMSSAGQDIPCEVVEVRGAFYRKNPFSFT